MRSYTCCFAGHRDVGNDSEYIEMKLTEILESLINRGVIYFGTGGARGFDTIAALTVLKMKRYYPQIKLILVLPCKNQTKGWNKSDIIKYDYVISAADKVRILSENYNDGCMLQRNLHLIKHSSICVCYKRKDVGGTAYTVRQALKYGLEVVEI